MLSYLLRISSVINSFVKGALVRYLLKVANTCVKSNRESKFADVTPFHYIALKYLQFISNQCALDLFRYFQKTGCLSHNFCVVNNFSKM